MTFSYQIACMTCGQAIILRFSGDGTKNFHMCLSGEIQKKFVEETKENLSILEGALEGKTFFEGDAIGLVDIAANFLALWAGVLQQVAGISLISEDKHPALWKLSGDFVSSDVVKECLPGREIFLTIMQSKKEANLVTKAPAY